MSEDKKTRKPRPTFGIAKEERLTDEELDRVKNFEADLIYELNVVRKKRGFSILAIKKMLAGTKYASDTIIRKSFNYGDNYVSESNQRQSIDLGFIVAVCMIFDIDFAYFLNYGIINEVSVSELIDDLKNMQRIITDCKTLTPENKHVLSSAQIEYVNNIEDIVLQNIFEHACTNKVTNASLVRYMADINIKYNDVYFSKLFAKCKSNNENNHSYAIKNLRLEFVKAYCVKNELMFEELLGERPDDVNIHTALQKCNHLKAEIERKCSFQNGNFLD